MQKHKKAGIYFKFWLEINMHELPSRERSETRLLLVISVKKAGKRSNVTYSSFGLTPP